MYVCEKYLIKGSFWIFLKIKECSITNKYKCLLTCYAFAYTKGFDLVLVTF